MNGIINKIDIIIKDDRNEVEPIGWVSGLQLLWGTAVRF